MNIDPKSETPDLKNLVTRIKQRAYLDSDEQIGRWIKEYAQSENQRLTKQVELLQIRDEKREVRESNLHKENGGLHAEIERLTKINEELVKALNIIPPEKFILLADWLDLVDKCRASAGNEVQQDLRRFAVQVKDALEKSKPLNHEQS